MAHTAAKHTATPWKYVKQGGYLQIHGNQELIAEMYMGLRAEANAALIVRAANAHDGLVEALKLVLSGLENGSIKSKPIIDLSGEIDANIPMMSLHSVIRAALAKAGEQ